MSKRFFYSFLLLITLNCYSQTQPKTVYEKKVEALTIQFFRNLGVNPSLLTQKEKIGELEGLFLASDVLQKLNTEKGVLLMLQLERQIKEAAKFKTAVDFQKEKAKKEEAERKKQVEIAKQKEKQRQAELKNQEEEKKELYNNSDYVQIKNEIQNDYKQWLEKGEFEKTEDYQNRITNTSSQAFDSICYKILVHNFKDKSGFSSNLLKYDADTEKFGIEFLFNDLKFTDSINIPLKDASKFKDEIEDFGIYIDDENWGFIENNLSPKKITFYNRDTKQGATFYFKRKELKEISISTSELSLNKPTMDLNFNFNKYFYNTVIYKIKDGNAINSLAWECLLNQKFNEALQILEKGIPLIDEKNEVYPYLLTNLAHAYLFNNQFDKAHKIYLENLTLKLNDKTWKEAILQDFLDFKEKGIQNADMEKIKQELLLL